MRNDDESRDMRDTRTFYDRLGSDADVVLEPGYQQDEIFDDQFSRRAVEIQRAPRAGNAVAVIPAKQGPWSGNNQLGFERPFSPDVNNRQTILRLDEWGFPEMWTLCLGMNQFSHEPVGLDPIGFDVTALVEFGCGGVIQEVEVDWLNGSAICLPMNALNVVARYSSNPGEGGTAVPLDLRLRANIVRGCAQFTRPTRTILFSELATSIPIPPFAKNVIVVPLFSAPGNVLGPFPFYSSGAFIELSALEDASSVGTATYQTSQLCTSIDFTNELVGGPVKIPIPPFARFLNTRNAAGTIAVINAAFAQFEIGL